MKTFLALIFILLPLLQCYGKEIPDLPSEIVVGGTMTLEGSNICDYDLFFFSNNFHKVVPFVYEGVEFELLFTRDRPDEIRGILLRDESVETPEGIRIGDPLSKLKTIKGFEVKQIDGFGYWVVLPSGWNAIFFQGKSLAKGELKEAAKVQMFAKYKYLR